MEGWKFTFLGGFTVQYNPQKLRNFTSFCEKKNINLVVFIM